MIPKWTLSQTWSSTSRQMTRVLESHHVTRNFTNLRPDKSLNTTKLLPTRKVRCKSLNQISSKSSSWINHTHRSSSHILSSVKRINRIWRWSLKDRTRAAWILHQPPNNKYTLIKYINKLLVLNQTKNKLKQHKTALRSNPKILKIRKHLYWTRVSEPTHLWSLGYDSSVEASRNDLRKLMDRESTVRIPSNLSNWLKISSQQS